MEIVNERIGKAPKMEGQKAVYLDCYASAKESEKNIKRSTWKQLRSVHETCASAVMSSSIQRCGLWKTRMQLCDYVHENALLNVQISVQTEHRIHNYFVKHWPVRFGIQR